MSENKKLELLDQYDDVTFALLMDEYAEEEGARLRKEFEEAQAAGKVSDTPDALDEKCLQMIHRDFAKKRGKENVRKIIRMTSKVAVAAMVFLGVLTATIMSVDALRIPFINYLVEHYEVFSAINISGESESLGEVTASSDPIYPLLPDAYSTIYFAENDSLINSGYQNNRGSTIYFDMIPGTSEYRFDTENAEYEYILIRGHEVMVISKDGLQAVWMDSNETTIFSLFSSDMTKEEFTKLIADIVQIYE